jgi:hypothetical protein
MRKCTVRLIDKRRSSSTLYARSFKGAGCYTDHYLLVTKVRGRLSVSKRAAQKFYVERFNLKRLNGVKVTEQYQVKILIRFAALVVLYQGLWLI